jgi:uncharacterized membrane protein
MDVKDYALQFTLGLQLMYAHGTTKESLLVLGAVVLFAHVQLVDTSYARATSELEILKLVVVCVNTVAIVLKISK